MAVPSNRPTTPPSYEGASVLDSEQSLRGTLPEGDPAFQPQLPSSSARLRVAKRRSTPAGGRLSNEAWASSVTGTPRVVVDANALRLLDVDHRAGFVLSLMDAMLDLDTVLDLCGMDRLEALQLIRDWHDAGVIAFR